MVGPESDQLEELGDAGAALALVAGKPMQHQRFAQHGAHGHARIERGVGILEDHLQALAPRAHCRGAERQQVDILEVDRAGRRLDQA